MMLIKERKIEDIDAQAVKKNPGTNDANKGEKNWGANDSNEGKKN